MNISNIAEKTMHLKYNGEQIEVASLSKELRYEVETLDRLTQRRLDFLCELETIELALRSQTAKLGELMRIKFEADKTPKAVEKSDEATS